jgi:hypothetical protein
MPGRFFSRWYTTRHREPPDLPQCPACRGGGEINDCGYPCEMCDGTGHIEPGQKGR